MAREHTGAWSARRQAELENRIVLLQAGFEIYEILKRASRTKGDKILQVLNVYIQATSVNF